MVSVGLLPPTGPVVDNSGGGVGAVARHRRRLRQGFRACPRCDEVGGGRGAVNVAADRLQPFAQTNALGLSDRARGGDVPQVGGYSAQAGGPGLGADVLCRGDRVAPTQRAVPPGAVCPIIGSR